MTFIVDACQAYGGMLAHAHDAQVRLRRERAAPTPSLGRIALAHAEAEDAMRDIRTAAPEIAALLMATPAANDDIGNFEVDVAPSPPSPSFPL